MFVCCFFKQKTAYEMRISDWSSDVCSSDLALVVDGAPELGVLYAPALDELWVARRGQGATLNGETLRASRRTRFDGARVPADNLPRIDRDLVMVTKPNSIALRIALVADDRADLLATLRWGFEWDAAAAALIAARSDE